MGGGGGDGGRRECGGEDAGMQVCRYACMQVCKCMQVRGYACMQVDLLCQDAHVGVSDGQFAGGEQRVHAWGSGWDLLLGVWVVWWVGGVVVGGCMVCVVDGRVVPDPGIELRSAPITNPTLGPNLDANLAAEVTTMCTCQ